MRKRITALLLLLTLAVFIPAAFAEGPDERFVSYERFIARYAENLDFINRGEGRHLISLIFSADETKGNYRVYRISGDILSAVMYTQKSEKRVVGFVLTLACPDDVNTDTGLMQDFTTSGYHCYALLMAMRDEEAAADRFPIVQQLNDGLRDRERYRADTGPYTLMARRKGSAVEFTFSSEYWVDGQSLADGAGEEAGEEDEDLPLLDAAPGMENGDAPDDAPEEDEDSLAG